MFRLMKKVVFTNSWKEYFERFHLTTFDDFYDYSDASNIGSNQKRNVKAFSLGEREQRKDFFIKRFHRPHLKDILSAGLNFGRPTTQAGVELKNARYLLANGIGTYNPVCIGEHTLTGIETKSFIVTEKLNSVCLLDFVLEKWRSLDRGIQDKIITAVAEQARKIHKLNISFPDLYLWHFFINPESPGGKIQLSVIDLHRMTQKNHSTRKKTKDLARLYWSMSPDYFDERQKDLLISSYIGDANSSYKSKLKKTVQKLAATLDGKRKLEYQYKRETADASGEKRSNNNLLQSATDVLTF